MHSLRGVRFSRGHFEKTVVKWCTPVCTLASIHLLLRLILLAMIIVGDERPHEGSGNQLWSSSAGHLAD